MALSLMPICEVERQFKRLRAVASSSLDDLFTYFNRQWINGNIPLSMWNSHSLDHRTNNISEGINKRLITSWKNKSVFFFYTSLQPAIWNTYYEKTPECMDVYTIDSE